MMKWKSGISGAKNFGKLASLILLNTNISSDSSMTLTSSSFPRSISNFSSSSFEALSYDGSNIIYYDFLAMLNFRFFAADRTALTARMP